MKNAYIFDCWFYMNCKKCIALPWIFNSILLCQYCNQSITIFINSILCWIVTIDRYVRMSIVGVCLEESCEIFPLSFLLMLASLIFMISKGSIDIIWTLEVFGFLEVLSSLELLACKSKKSSWGLTLLILAI